MVLGPDSACGEYLQLRGMAAAWRQLTGGWRDTSRLMWALLMLELWARKFLRADIAADQSPCVAVGREKEATR
jgi:hypothetical protein